MLYGAQVVEESHLVRFVRLHEIERVISGMQRGKGFQDK